MIFVRPNQFKETKELKEDMGGGVGDNRWDFDDIDFIHWDGHTHNYNLHRSLNASVASLGVSGSHVAA